MAGASEGESEFIGYAQAVALVKSYQQQGHPVWLNADHHKSFESCRKAIDAGYDTVLIDASRLNLDENIFTTSQVVRYAKEKNPQTTIEGELGYLRGSSEIQEKIEISSDDYARPEQAESFVAQTKVDRLAIAFGNIHGITTKQEMRLDMGLLKKIVAIAPDTVLVLHGGSGLPQSEIQEAIKNGISNVHINTDLRVAYHNALEEELEEEPNQTTPYKFLAPSFEAMKKMVKQKLELFGSTGKS